MRIITLLFAGLFSSIVLQAQDGYYGSRIDSENAISMTQLIQRMEAEGLPALEAKVEGKVIDCCQTKGCWMNIEAGDGNTMRVKFKDYGFFVPKSSAGRTAVMKGVATMETTSVAELKHFAEDAGKSKEEIEKITKPEKELVFLAEGVILKD